MVSGAAPALTRIGFRRDVRLFLGILVGFLATLVFILLFLLADSVSHARESVLRSRQSAAAAAAETFTARREIEGAQTVLGRLRTRYDIPVIEWRSGGRRVISGFPGQGLDWIVVQAAGGTLHFGFDAAPLRDLQRRFLLTATLSAAATICGMTFLFLYLPRITRPIEQMLDHAGQVSERGEHVDETDYLIETFRTSIDRLKAQEEELRVLHDAQKRRADDLERVTATLTRSLTSGFMAIDRSGKVLQINSAGRAILDLGDRTFTGSSIAGMLGESPFAAAVAHDFTNRQWRSRDEIALADKTIGVTTVPLFNESDEFLGLLVLFADLTEVRQLEQRLRGLQTLAELGEMSAGIAHEFRNSLSTIQGYLALARRVADAPAEERIRRAEEEAVLLSRSVDALLTFARQVKLAPELMELQDLARDIVRRLDDPPSGIAFTFEGDEVEVEADPLLLGRAIENVLRNAIDAVRAKGEGGRITVCTAAFPHPSLTITDTGIGLDPADAPRLLLPFQSDKPSGMGLGLAIARKIVAVHGGTLMLTGAPGEGATVTIELAAASLATPLRQAARAK